MSKKPDERERPATIPTSFPDTTPQNLPSADYTYVLEIVMNMQVSVGKLIEAVDSMRGQIKDHGSELKTISQDIHAAKTTLKVVGAIVAAGLAFAGWLVNKGVDAYVNSRPSTAAQQPK